MKKLLLFFMLPAFLASCKGTNAKTQNENPDGSSSSHTSSKPAPEISGRKDSSDSLREQWIGYYETEVDLPVNDTSEPESSFVTYALEITSGTCTFYKSQLHANDIYECEAREVTADRISLQATGDYAPDTDGEPLVVLYKKGDTYYIKGPFIFDSKYKTDVMIKIDKAVSRHWAGAYSLSVGYGESNEFSKMEIYYYFDIREHTASVTAEGYRTSFECECTVKEEENRLALLYRRTVESLTDVPVKNEGDTVAILVREQNNYYVQSPVIADSAWNYNTRLPLTKETSGR